MPAAKWLALIKLFLYGYLHSSKLPGFSFILLTDGNFCRPCFFGGHYALLADGDSFCLGRQEGIGCALLLVGNHNSFFLAFLYRKAFSFE